MKQCNPCKRCEMSAHEAVTCQHLMALSLEHLFHTRVGKPRLSCLHFPTFLVRLARIPLPNCVSHHGLSRVQNTVLSSRGGFRIRLDWTSLSTGLDWIPRTRGWVFALDFPRRVVFESRVRLFWAGNVEFEDASDDMYVAFGFDVDEGRAWKRWEEKGRRSHSEK